MMCFAPPLRLGVPLCSLHHCCIVVSPGSAHSPLNGGESRDSRDSPPLIYPQSNMTIDRRIVEVSSVSETPPEGQQGQQGQQAEVTPPEQPPVTQQPPPQDAILQVLSGLSQDVKGVGERAADAVKEALSSHTPPQSPQGQQGQQQGQQGQQAQGAQTEVQQAHETNQQVQQAQESKQEQMGRRERFQRAWFRA